MTAGARGARRERGDEELNLRDLELCFEGGIPAVIASASGGGTPNITYLSCVRLVDDERLALSNQFFSKTIRNLAENPRASLLVIDPSNYDEYRLRIVYERTERRGPIFERLRDDVDTVAALQSMQHVFKLRAADIYRVLQIERMVPSRRPLTAESPIESERRERARAQSPARLAELIARLTRCPDLDAIVATAVDGLAELLGFAHSFLMLLDEHGERLYTIASHGYDAQGVGSEVVVGEGTVGMAAARATTIRIGNLRQIARYSRAVRREYEETGVEPGREIPMPGLADAQSRLAVPGLALGQLVCVLVVESTVTVAFDADDESMLNVVTSVIANAIELERTRESSEDVGAPRTSVRTPPAPGADVTHVRFFAVDGSTFLDGDYLIKGVAGRILWSLLGHYTREGRVDFTNKEVRLDPSLELPEFRDNLDSRLLLLKRRLDERGAPIHIDKTGRGRFRLVVDTTLRRDTGGT
jgi:predicted pyridoxine 5'-phosphate oxidase superfamily flavin-nucleotide-binding protein